MAAPYPGVYDMSTTVIRHAVTIDGFILVASCPEGEFMVCTVQVYTRLPDGRTVLEDSSRWSSEAGAVNHFKSLAGISPQ